VNVKHSERKKASPIRILLTDTDRRAYAARLAMAFAALGCEVSIVCTEHHPIESIRASHREFHYSGLYPLESLSRAIESVEPDIVLPCDDRAVQHLHELCRQRSAQFGPAERIVKLIERSLGPSDSHSIVSSRYEFLRLAQEGGIRVPPTFSLQTDEDLSELQKKLSFPWVLKADGTWGGSGVRISGSLDNARSMFQALKTPCSLKRAVKRAMVNRDTFYLRDWRQAYSPAVIAQAFVSGRPANCAIACWEGKVIAQLNVEVLATSSATGPASVVRIVNNPDMVKASEMMANKLHLSGLFGLDFIIETGSNATYLLEMNPRCTPLCHIQMDGGPDLIAALHACLAGLPVSEVPAMPTQSGQVISYFSAESNPNNEFHGLTFEDFPHGEPELARALLRPFPAGTLLYRIVDYLSPTPLTYTYESTMSGTSGTTLKEESTIEEPSWNDKQEQTIGK
jgi:hypothetical protein